MVGLLNLPRDREERSCAVVFLNAGIIHRPGPNRIHVRLARKLAVAGWASFRIDMAGIGDSGDLGTSESVDEECLLSVGSALDVLEARGVASRFVLFGLCSGAEYAFRYARRDPRVIGVIGIDPPSMDRSRKYYVMHFLSALKRPVVWFRLLKGRYGVTRRLLGHFRGRAQRSLSVGSVREWVREALATLVARDVRLLLIISGTGRRRYNYATQLFDLYPGLGLEKVTEVAILPGAAHTFTREVDRRALEDQVSGWLEVSTATDVDGPRARSA